MSTRIGPYSAVDWATFSVDATTALTLNSATATGNNLDAAEAGGVKVTKVIVSCPAANVRFAVAGGTPTSSTWHRLVAGDVLELDSGIRKFKFIGEVAGPSTVYVDFLGD